MIEPVIAIDIARQRAKENGWGFAEPLEMTDRRDRFGGVARFEIMTNAGNLGTKARFSIDATNGGIISEGYISR
jgi:hypothetical protein